MHCRLIMPYDVDRVVDLLRMQVEENCPHQTFSEEVARGVVRRAIEEAEPTIFVAVSDAGRVVGYMIAKMQGYLAMEGLRASHAAVFVDPRHRGGRAGVALFRALEEWGETIGASEITAGVSTGQNVARIESMLTKMGFETVGVCMRKIKRVGHEQG